MMKAIEREGATRHDKHAQTSTQDGNRVNGTVSDANGSKWEVQFEPYSYTEGVSIAGTEYGGLKCVYLAECTYDAEQRFLQRLLLEPKLTPLWFSSTTFLVIDSTRKRYKDLVLLRPKLKTSSFSETVLIFPKAVRHVFTTTVTYNKQWRVTKWYTSGMEFSPEKNMRLIGVVKRIK